jgi:hypothetical protein
VLDRGVLGQHHQRDLQKNWMWGREKKSKRSQDMGLSN